MSYFKKVGAFCSGFACFAACMWMLAEYMTYNPGNATLGQKLEMFFDPTRHPETGLMAALIIMLALSVAADVALKRLPYLTLLFSVMPLILTIDMVKDDYIEDYPMLYVLFCALSVISGVWECIEMDRRDGGHRAGLAGDAVCALTAGVLAFIWWAGTKFVALTPEELKSVNVFEYEINKNAPLMDMRLFGVLACVYLVLMAVSYLMKDLYFIDTLLALVPCVAVIYLWSADKWTVQPEIVATLAVTVLVTRLVPTLSGGRKDQK